MPAGSRPNPPAHTVHVAVSGTVDSTYRWANGFWIRNGNASAPDISDLTTFAGDFAADWADAFARIQSARSTMNLVKILYYGAAGADLGVDVGVSYNGTGSSEVLPANCAMCISWKVQQRYKGGHARTYIGGVDQDTQDNAGSFLATEANTARDSANDFLEAVNARSAGDLDDLHLGVVSFVHNNAWRTPPVFRDYVPGAASVDQRIDSQRRRLGRDL